MEPPKTPDEPIPFPWVARTSSKGKTYYYNEETGESKWHVPVKESVADEKETEERKESVDHRDQHKEERRDHHEDERRDHHYHERDDRSDHRREERRDDREGVRRCFTCNLPGHIARECPQQRGGMGRGRGMGGCWNCGQPGHVARQCMNRPPGPGQWQGGPWGPPPQGWGRPPPGWDRRY